LNHIYNLDEKQNKMVCHLLLTFTNNHQKELNHSRSPVF